MRIGLGLGITDLRGGGGAPFLVSLTGLTSGAAIVGDHASIGYTTDPVSATESVKWSNSGDPASAATYGTGANPTDYTAGDGDGAGGNLYLHVTDTIDGETYTVTRSALIRKDFGTAPAVADGQNTTVDDGPAYNIDASASGTGLTFSYVLSGMPAGVSINISTGAITGTPTEALSGTATVTATDQYGATYQDTFTFAAALRTQATASDGLGPFVWTVDDTTVNVDATTDFTANGNTLTYTATGLPAGVTIATNGIISGTPTAASSGSIVITAQDEYGRETTSTATHTTSLRTQATGGTDLDLSYAISTTITPQDLLANWTDNGNELTFVSVSPALPSGLSIGSSGILSGTTGGTAVADATYTLTMQDEYGRETSDTFALEVVEAAGQQGIIDALNAGDAFFDLTDPTTMTVARDGTGAAPVPGTDVVGTVADLNGVRSDLEARADGGRPALNAADGGCEFDGSDDELMSPGSLPATCDLWIIYTPVTGNTHIAFDGNSAVTGGSTFAGASQSGSSSAPHTGVTGSPTYTVTKAGFTSAALTTRDQIYDEVNASKCLLEARGVVSTWGSVALSGYATAGFAFEGPIYGFLVLDNADDTHRDTLRALIEDYYNL